MHLSEGMMVGASLRLLRPLSEGAMGVLWIAEHLTLKTEVAVSFIGADLAGDNPEVLERFAREALLTARIKSPYVVKIFDHGVMADGTPYIVMDLIEDDAAGALVVGVLVAAVVGLPEAATLDADGWVTRLCGVASPQPPRATMAEAHAMSLDGTSPA